jgi:hypothetical protein
MTVWLMVRPDGTLDMIDSAAVADRLKGEGKRLLGPYVPAGAVGMRRYRAELRMDVERVAVKDDTEGRAIAWCETADDASRITVALNNDAGAVRFTDAERDRVLWWLRRPVHPGPMKDLDEAILRKLTSEANR